MSIIDIMVHCIDVGIFWAAHNDLLCIIVTDSAKAFNALIDTTDSGVQLRKYFADFQKTLPELSQNWQSDG